MLQEYWPPNRSPDLLFQLPGLKPSQFNALFPFLFFFFLKLLLHLPTWNLLPPADALPLYSSFVPANGGSKS